MRLRLFLVGEAPGGFEHDVHAERFPRELRRILLARDFHAFAVDHERVAIGTHVAVESSVHRVVLEEVRERRRVGEIVHRDELEVGFLRERRAQHQAPDPTEPVDPDFDGHGNPG
jgi:hypothetical protein